MPTVPGADQVRLRLPALAPMARVVGVAVRVLAGRAGLAEAAVEQARVDVGDAFRALIGEEPDQPVDLFAEITPGLLVVDLTTAAGTRRVTASR